LFVGDDDEEQNNVNHIQVKSSCHDGDDKDDGGNQPEIGLAQYPEYIAQASGENIFSSLTSKPIVSIFFNLSPCMPEAFALSFRLS